MVMIAHTLTYGNVSSSEHGVYISGEGVYNAPERVVELVSIPGRNGALTIDQGHYDNITIEYPCFTFATSQEEFRRIVNNFKNAMIAQGGYQRLSDDYNPDEYRMALFVEGIEFEPVQYGRAGSFTLTFNCKPQRYLVDGDNEVTITNGSTLNNPTLYDSEPLLMVEGYGNIGFNGYNIELEDATVGNVNLLPVTKSSGKVATLRYNPTTDVWYDLDMDSIVIIKTLENASLMEKGDTFTFTVQWSVDGTTRIDSGATVSHDNITFTSATDATKGTTSSYSLNHALASSTYDVAISADITFLYGYYQYLTFDTTVTTSGNNPSPLKVRTSIIFLEDGTLKVYYSILQFARNDTLKFVAQNTTTYIAYLDYSISEAIGTSTLSLLGHPTYIDCEIGECYIYNDGVPASLNAYVDLGSDLPKLASGINTFTLSDTITSLIVVPRFWQL